MDPGQNFSQRALPRAVLTASRMPRAGAKIERQVVERTRAGEPLRDVLEADSGRGHGCFRYASGTSVNPQSFNCRAHVPSVPFVTLTSSIGMICGTSFFN